MTGKPILVCVLLIALVVLSATPALQASAQEEGPTPSPIPESISTPQAEPTSGPALEIRQDLLDIAGSSELSILERIDLLRLSLAIAVIILASLFGRRIVANLLARLASRTRTTFDDELVDRVSGPIRWLVITLGIDIGSTILFLDNEPVRTAIENILFWIYYVSIFAVFYTTIRFFGDWYERQLDDDQIRIAMLLPILERALLVLLFLLASVILLEHIGISVSGLAAATALIGLAVALAAQDIIGDLISGYVILVDRPFSEGDRIEIPDQNTWGDVVEIGTRTTRIRTRDNNLVIMPNSSIAHGQVTNYTYPDPNYRLQTDIGIGYGEDLKRIRHLLADAVRGVDQVLKDEPVQVLFLNFGDSAMTIRVRWWIGTYSDKRLMQDKVNSALQDAIAENGIDSPLPTSSVQVNVRHDEPQENS